MESFVLAIFGALLENAEWVLAFLLGGGLGTVVGLAVSRLISMSRRDATVAELSVESTLPLPSRSDDWESFTNKKRLEELEAENAELHSLFLLLPGLTRKLNQTNNKRDIAPLLVTIVERLCLPPPPKILVMFVSKNEHLVVAAQKGYSEQEIPAHLTVPMDKGYIGYALERQITMDTKDFARFMVKGGDVCAPEYPGDRGFRSEVVAPILHDREVYGAISVEGFPSYDRNAKKMLMVASNLGAIAIRNASILAQIQFLADSDQLTRLYNKRFFMEAAEAALEKARRFALPLSVFIFDIDNFKNFNDTNGHQAGDECLALTAKVLRERIRETDLAARYGGEEFIVLLPETGPAGALSFAEDLRRRIAEYPHPNEEHQPLGRVTISGGVATYPEDGSKLTELIEQADTALYDGKRQGRNCIGGRDRESSSLKQAI